MNHAMLLMLLLFSIAYVSHHEAMRKNRMILRDLRMLLKITSGEARVYNKRQ